MTDLLEPRAIGRDLVRRDGELKTRGAATYAYEVPASSAAYAHLVQASIGRGRVTAVDTAAAEALDGVLTVLTPFNAERLASTDDREYAVLQSDEVAFRGQAVAVVVAETSELARQAADAVVVTYDEQPHDSELTADHDDLYAPDALGNGSDTDTSQGDVTAAMATAEVTLERTYSTAMYHNNPLEPHATTALWDPAADVRLTLWDSTQGVHPARAAVCEVFGLEQERVRVVCPYVGGGFGSKGEPHANLMLATMAARALPGRPVKLALTRQQMFFLAGYRTPTIQRMQLAADRSGRLQAIAVDVTEQTSKVKEFAEQTGAPGPDDVRRPQPAHDPPAGRPGRTRQLVDARAGRVPGNVRPRGGHGRARRESRHRPDRAARPERAGGRPGDGQALVEPTSGGVPA